jgi:uncharacterized repeat protein (TIGR02543 family)
MRKIWIGILMVLATFTAMTPTANAGMQTLSLCGIYFNRNIPLNMSAFTYEQKFALTYDKQYRNYTSGSNVQFPNAYGGVLLSPHTTLLGTSDTSGGLEIYYNTIYLPNGQLLIFMGKRSGKFSYFTNPAWNLPDFTEAQGSSPYLHIAVVRDTSNRLTVFFEGVGPTEVYQQTGEGGFVGTAGNYLTDPNVYTSVDRVGYSSTFTSDINPKQYISNVRLVTGSALYDPLATSITVPSITDLRLHAPTGTTELLLNSTSPAGVVANSSSSNSTAAAFYNFSSGSAAQIAAGQACDLGNPASNYVGGEGVYNVYYDDGSVIKTSGTLPTRTYYDGTAVPVVPIIVPTVGTLVKTGYAFVGWNTRADGTGTAYAPGSSYTPTANSTLYTKWEAAYTVTFANGGGTGTLPTQSALATGGTFTLPANPFTKSNSIFTGWNDGSSIYAAGATYTMGSANKTLTATWTAGYTATFNSNSATSGTVPASQSYTVGGDTLTISANTGNLLRTGYTFAGWATTANGTGTTYTEGQTGVTLSAGITLYAKWTANNYTVTYNSNSATSGTIPSSQSYTTAGATLTISINSGTLERTGYSFVGWATAANGTGTTYTVSQAGVTLTADTTLYAKWTAASNVVTYNSQLGTAVSNGSFVTGSTLTLPAAPSRTGYTFAGWFAATTGGTALVTGYSPTETSAITLYAQWTGNSYTVTYNLNSATSGAVPSAQSYTSGGSTLTISTNSGTLERAGYSFVGWATAANGTGTTYTGGQTGVTVTADTTLYAQWTAGSNVVTYDSQGGSAVSNGSFVTGSTLTLPAAPSRIGYTFAGWFRNATGGSALVSGYYPTETASFTRYAQWTGNTYTVTYNLNSATSGSVPSPQSYVSGTTALTISTNSGTMVRTGYTFASWNTAANGTGTTYTEGQTGVTVTANTTLYAQWTANTYTVTYNLNSATSGTIPLAQSYTSGGSTLTILTNSGTLDRTGYIFAGWNTAADGTGTSYTVSQTGVVVTANTILHAKWTAKTARTLGFSTTSLNKTYGETVTVAASFSTGVGTITYSRGSSTACTIDSSTGLVTITHGVGTCVISASSAEDSSYTSSATSTAVTITVAYRLPNTPTLGSITSVDGVLKVPFTQSDSAGNGITNYKYSLDGINFISVGGTTSPLSISGLTPGSYSLQIVAVNSIGESTPTAPVTVVVVQGPTITSGGGGGGGGGVVYVPATATEIAVASKPVIDRALADKTLADKALADKTSADRALAEKVAEFQNICSVAPGATALIPKSSTMKIYSQLCFVSGSRKLVGKDLIVVQNLIAQLKYGNINAITLSSYADEKSGVDFKAIAKTRANVVAAMIRRSLPNIRISYRLYGSSTKKDALSSGRIVVTA